MTYNCLYDNVYLCISSTQDVASRYRQWTSSMFEGGMLTTFLRAKTMLPPVPMYWMGGKKKETFQKESHCSCMLLYRMPKGVILFMFL